MEPAVVRPARARIGDSGRGPETDLCAAQQLIHSQNQSRDRVKSRSGFDDSCHGTPDGQVRRSQPPLLARRRLTPPRRAIRQPPPTAFRRTRPRSGTSCDESVRLGGPSGRRRMARRAVSDTTAPRNLKGILLVGAKGGAPPSRSSSSGRAGCSGPRRLRRIPVGSRSFRSGLRSSDSPPPSIRSAGLVKGEGGREVKRQVRRADPTAFSGPPSSRHMLIGWKVPRLSAPTGRLGAGCRGRPSSQADVGSPPGCIADDDRGPRDGRGSAAYRRGVSFLGGDRPCYSLRLALVIAILGTIRADSGHRTISGALRPGQSWDGPPGATKLGAVRLIPTPADPRCGRLPYPRAGDTIDVRSSGSAPTDQANPVRVAAMAEEGGRRSLPVRTGARAALARTGCLCFHWCV